MRKIGLIGGISWVSTLDYYRHINAQVNQRLGKLHAAECIIYSFDYQRLVDNNERGDWDKTLDMVTEACRHLQNVGAEAILLCANTMHMIADRLAPRLQVPIIHIAEVTAQEISNVGLNKVALLGTRFTMEQDFFKKILQRHGIETLIPGDEDRTFIHTTISEELGRNIFLDDTRKRYQRIIDDLAAQGAQGVILGCTEIPLLIKQGNSSIPTFDTVKIHSNAAVDFALGETKDELRHHK